MASSSSMARTDSNELYLVNIPPNLNTILNLHSYFSKFGKVIDVDVALNNDPKASKITFATNGEAVAAFNSPAAVLNNRFIEMSWDAPQVKTTSALKSSGSNQNDGMKCSDCNKTFASTWHRDQHMKRMHNPNESGIICTDCGVTFASNSSFKKHCIVKHPTKTSPNQSEKKTFKYERSPVKFDHFAVQHNELLRIKNKALKETLKECEKNHSKEKRSFKKKKKSFEKKKKHFEEQLKEKDAGMLTMQQQLATLQECNTKLEQSNMALTQELQNERMKVELVQEALMAVCGRANFSKIGNRPQPQQTQ